MDTKKARLIRCPNCGQEAPLKIERIFDDSFNLIGERKLCSLCKGEFLTNEIPYIHEKSQTLFDPNAERRICQFCKNYVVNPWTQKCTLWNKEVTATDTCEKFDKKEVSDKS